MEWLDQEWQKGKTVSVKTIQNKARELAGDKDWASNGWWDRFKRRYNINFTCTSRATSTAKRKRGRPLKHPEADKLVMKWLAQQ